MPVINPQIEASWKAVLAEEFEKPYFVQLRDFLVTEKKQYRVFPPGPLIFNAFNLTPLEQVKVVMLGQDPYHGEGQAHGLCFSVPDGIKPPPSLINIFKEMHDDLLIPVSKQGNLEKWARQGVLLLNATLTVRANQPGSHQRKGWEIFTDQVMQKISSLLQNRVFILWGNYARAKAPLIHADKHLILTAAHPSPYSATNGFFGCKHFSKTNDYLQIHHKTSIEWDLQK
jgi:uracil-DNA glycosylase